jgi:ABC-type phosphate/phosphonate transport system substrate-binding protein
MKIKGLLAMTMAGVMTVGLITGCSSSAQQARRHHTAAAASGASAGTDKTIKIGVICSMTGVRLFGEARKTRQDGSRRNQCE